MSVRSSASRKRPVAHERRSIELQAGPHRLVVVADTHGRPHPNCARLLAAEHPDTILHAGDIGELQVLDELGRIAPVLAIRGNIDTPERTIPDELTVDLVREGRSVMKVLLVHYGVNGPKLRREVAELARSEGASLVVCGHSHVPFIGRDKGLAVFNPGSIGPLRFGLPIVFGVIELRDGALGMRHVDCETGETWMP